MFFRSLQWRLVSLFCMIAFCLIIPIGISLNRSVEEWYYKDFKGSIERWLNDWKPDLSGGASADKIYEILKESVNSYFYRSTFTSYTVVNAGNNWEFCTSDSINYEPERKDDFVNDLLSSKNFIKALKGETGGEKRLENYGGRSFFDYAAPQGGFILYFRCYKDLWQPVLNTFNRMIATSLMIAFVVAFALGYALSKTVTVPLAGIMQKAESIAAGDFGQALEIKSEDEIGKLAGAFNHMAKSLKDTLAEISNEKSKIETILNYMTDGIIAFNLKGEIIHTNPASRQLLKDNDFDGKFNEFSSKYGLGLTLEEILRLDSLNGREITINADDRSLRVYFAVFTDEAKKPGGVITVLQDITEQQKLENMRKEFVANVSHELRTPLTSIKSYAETLLDVGPEDRETSEKFLRVINSEADRMTRLVRDLLQLSRLDGGQMQWNIQEISLAELVKSSVEKMEIEAANKNQKLECFFMDEGLFINGDYDRLQQVMLNILSNAVKYTPKGGMITVRAGKMQNEAYIAVADTGIGIPEKDIPRVFERFYRVDKARSREMGGTGLGLAIARDIVEAHSGSIILKSEIGKGTEVTVKLPFEPGMNM